MPSTLSSYWSRQQNFSGRWLHPDDNTLLASNARFADNFNFDYPAVPFIGNPDAPVILLLANGGWDDVATPKEFEAPGAVQRHLARLAQPDHAGWKDLCPYYKKRVYISLLEAGELVAVNLCGYRSRKVPQNIGSLPSAQLHQQWLMNEVLQAVSAGERFLVAHRFGDWLPRGSRIRKEISPWMDGVHGILSTNSISPDPSHVTQEAITRFLSARH